MSFTRTEIHTYAYHCRFSNVETICIMLHFFILVFISHIKTKKKKKKKKE